jgi:hypothetical protein
MRIEITTIGKAVFIKNIDFSFMYDKEMSNSENANNLDNVFNYFGGLQCNHKEESKEFKEFEQKLCVIANNIIKLNK